MIAQILIGIVFVINIQCALAFMVNPAKYMYGFGLEGGTGEQTVRAFGLLFVMWNVPYAFALFNPVAYRVSLIEANIMQAIGFIGESCILWIGGPYSAPINQTIKRFIAFDGIGLIFLLAALRLVNIKMRSRIKS